MSSVLLTVDVLFYSVYPILRSPMTRVEGMRANPLASDSPVVNGVILVLRALKSWKIRRIIISASVFATLLYFFGNIVRRGVTDLHSDSFNEANDVNAPYQPVDDALVTRIWNRRKNVHAAYMREADAQHSKIDFTTIAAKSAYDYFEPEWNCEDEVRIGPGLVNVGDGPKFVCGSAVLASTEGCIVYSIGSNYDFSFEYAVNSIAPHCEIHTFDGTLNLTKRALPEGLEDKNIHFHNWNIVSDCRSEELAKLDSPSYCVSNTLLKLNHHESTTITWLKIDCEGCEFTVIPKFTESTVKIDQLMIEVHGTNALQIASLFSCLHDAGMMIFHKERNHLGCDGYKCVEYSLMTSHYAKRVLRAFLNMKDRWIYELHTLSGLKGPKSQGAQDFYFEQIFANIGSTNRYFVEFGFNEPNYTSGGSGANTWNLYDLGWRGLLLDGTRENADINLHAHYLFEQNIATILSKYKVPKEPDLLSCDMDSHDIFVLRGILNAGYRPRVFTTEYNSNYPLEYAIALIDPTVIGEDVSNYDFGFKGCAWGASASALRIIAEKFGYTLIGRVGLLDLVWLRNDLIEENWEVPPFEWFFEDAPSGSLLHFNQTSHEIFEYLVDFNLLEKTGSILGAKEAARSALERSDLPCFSSLRMTE